MQPILQYVLYLLLLVVLAVPLGRYISKVMDGERVFLTKVLQPVEYFIYRVLRVTPEENMGWKQYAG